jgi:phospholipase C
MSQPIKHLVVLMLENRSFDHMFGFLQSASYPIDGLGGTETNPDSTGVPVAVSHDAHYTGDLSVDPGHDFVSVNEQIFGNSQGTGNGPYMQGFVEAYEAKTGNLAKSHNIMRCFNPGRIPALVTLAQHYAICDRWFASVPGPTLPNRAFTFGATSHGRVDMTPTYVTLKTIFELLDKKGVPSKIYYTDWSLGLAIGYIVQHSGKFLSLFDDFLKDCKNNNLPALSFIEPRFNGVGASDQHPDHNVFNGEKIIAQVYDAITSNQQSWEETLLVITYDEHGGLFDHVTPPKATPPGDGASSVFAFDRLGVRVPAVLVSPFIEKGTIVKDIFEHTSIIATAINLFIGNHQNVFLTERDRNARPFDDVPALSTARTDLATIPDNPTDWDVTNVTFTPLAASTGVTAGFSPHGMEPAATGPSGPDLNDLQKAMVDHAFAIDANLPAADQTNVKVSAIRSENQVGSYLGEIRSKLIGK